MTRRQRVGFLILTAVLGLPRTGEGAAWGLVDDTVSNTSAISLTTSSGRCVGKLPNGSLYAVWYERRTQNSSDIRGAHRSPGGAWIVDPVLSGGDSLSRNPTLVVTGDGGLHVAWEDRRHNNDEIYYRHRNPNGVWDPEERLTNGSAPSQSPALAAGTAGRVHLVWVDGSTGNLEIHFQTRDAAGMWSGDRTLTSDPGASQHPAIEMDPSGDLHVVWQDEVLNPAPGENDFGNIEIYHLRLDETGAPLSQPFRVSAALGLSQWPALAIAPDGAVHVFWCDNRDHSPLSPSIFPFAIWYRRWLPGLGFGHEKRFSYSAFDHLNPTVAAGPDGTINVVWEDYSHGNSELYFRQISPLTGWDVQNTRLTETIGATRGPAIISDPEGDLHLVWSDTGAGEEPSIRYRTGHVDSTTPVILNGLSAEWRYGALRLDWRTSSEVDHAGFLVFAAPDPEDEATRITEDLVTGGPDYTLDIPGSRLEEARCLKLVALSRGGELQVVATIPVPAEGEPGAALPTRLLPPFPNPSRGPLTLEMETGAPGTAILDIIDVQGRRVVRIDLGTVPAGTRQVVWNRLRSDGEPLAPGRYWARLLIEGRPAGKPVSLTLVN